MALSVRTIANEYFKYDKSANRLIGSETGLKLELGMSVRVKLSEVDPFAGGIVFKLTHLENEKLNYEGSKGRSKIFKKNKYKTRNKKVKIKRRERRIKVILIVATHHRVSK